MDVCPSAATGITGRPSAPRRAGPHPPSLDHAQLGEKLPHIGRRVPVQRIAMRRVTAARGTYAGRTVVDQPLRPLGGGRVLAVQGLCPLTGHALVVVRVKRLECKRRSAWGSLRRRRLTPPPPAPARPPWQIHRL